MNRKLKIIAAAGSLFAFVLITSAAQLPDLYFEIKKNFTIFSEVFREVSLNYVDEVNPGQLMRRGIDSMLESLDPYTVFIDESQNQEIDIMTRGNYGGVGLELGFKGDRIVVIAPMEGYSAQRRGIRTGDIILAVDTLSAENLSSEEVQNLLLGEPGSTVRLTIERFGTDRDLEFVLNRERIEVKNITYYGLTGSDRRIGYILLSRFSQNAAEEVRNAILELLQSAELEGLILDLRNNPGGLLGEAVGTVDKFVGPGVKVVETRGRLSEHTSIYRGQEPALLNDLPLVVLQNGGSASASEIVAGALQDLDRAVIIGEQSFGKGLVQIVNPLSYNTAIKITTAKYFIPSGRSIQSLTYTHDEDNTAILFPDSARRAFTTRNGRTVYDGQGIAPDIYIEESVPTLLETALFQDSHFFFFANQYVASNNTFEANEVSEQVYSDFRGYLDEQNFSYETLPEQKLEELSSYFDDNSTDRENLEGLLLSLERVIQQEKEEAFEAEEESLRRILFLELMSRYNGKTGYYATSLQYDRMVTKAVEVINNANEYRQILAINQ